MFRFNKKRIIYFSITMLLIALPSKDILAGGLDVDSLPKIKGTIKSYYTKPFDSPQAITLDLENNELYVVDSYSNELLIFDLEGTPIAKLSSKHGLRSPLDIVVRNEKYYISQNGKPHVDVFDFLGNIINKLTLEDRKFSPGMMFSVNDGNLYVINKLVNELIVFDSNDNYLRSIGSGDERLLSLTGAAIGVDKVYLFTPFSQEKAIHVYSIEGEFLYSFESVAGLQGGGSMGLPIRGVVDKNNNLWVVDALKGIIVFDSEDKKVNSFGQLQKNGVRKVLKYPIDIDFGPNNEVYILEELSKEISIFR